MPDAPPPILAGFPVRWQLDNMVFGAVDAQGCAWYCTKSDGWFGPPKPKTQRQAKFQTQGSFRSLAPRGERIIALNGSTRCPSVLARLDALDRFAAMASDPTIEYTLTVTDQSQRPRTATVEIDASPQDTKLVGPHWFDWQFQLGAPDPRKHDAVWQAPSIGLTQPTGGGLDFSSGGLDFSSGGLDFGSYSSAPSTATVTNVGTQIAYPLFQLAGPVVNPTITDVTSGITLIYAGTLGASDTLSINCDDFAALGVPNKGVFLNTAGNRRSLLVGPPPWPQVGPGEQHSFEFTGGGGAPALLTVMLRSCWL
jgi:hypothetical protein